MKAQLLLTLDENGVVDMKANGDELVLYGMLEKGRQLLQREFTPKVQKAAFIPGGRLPT